MSQEQILNNLKAYQERLIKQANIFIKQEAELIMTDSKEQCPVDTGALRSSGYVDGDVTVTGSNVSIKLGYGGVATQVNSKTGEPTTSYALQVHENLESHHPVGKAKFLEDPFNAHQKDLSARFAESLKGVTP